MKIASKTVVGTTLTFAWADESTTVVNLEDFSPELIERAAMHGLSQKLGDSYSGIKNVDDAQFAMREVIESLSAGDWNRKGEAAGGVWIEAIVQASGQAIADVVAKWAEMDDAAKAAVKKNPQVKLAKAMIDAAKAQAKADQGEAFTI